MSVFANFRVRNRVRDRSTDTERFNDLLQFVRKLGNDAAEEMNGLKKRYEQATTDASLAFMAEENEGASRETSQHIRELTETIMNYSDRVKNLERQVGYFEQLEREVSEAAKHLKHPVAGSIPVSDS